MLWYGSVYTEYLCGFLSVPCLVTRDRATHLHDLALVVASVDGVFLIARRRQKLPSVNRDWREDELAGGVHVIRAVLPLHDSTGTLWVLCYTIVSLPVLLNSSCPSR